MQKVLKKAPVIGFVRYSQYIKFGDRERDMFEEEYFEYRFKIFISVTLKSFQQQTNNDFVLLLLHSVNMPEVYKERFLELERANSFLYNLFLEDTQESFTKAIGDSVQYVSFEQDTAVSFRIDNDDAVQIDFIQKLSGFLKENFIDNCISFPIMYRIKHIAEQFFMIEEFYFPANAIGLAYVTDRKNYKTVLELGDHDLVNNQNSMIVLPKSAGGGLMTINGENAVNTINRDKSIILNKKNLEKYLKEKKIENVDLDCLRIITEEKRSARFSLQNVIKYVMPPIIPFLIAKIKTKKINNL